MSYSKSLLDLPDELLVLIVKRLEFADQVNVYDTCHRLRMVLSERNVVLCCRLGCRPLATAETFRHPLFKLQALCITDLDLMLIKDLNKTKLLPALKRMSNLTSLNLSYTDVAFDEFHLICDVCPKLVKISIGLKNIEHEDQPKIIRHLEKMESIHFVNNSSTTMLMTLLPFINGSFPKLKELRYTGASERFSMATYFSEHTQNNVKISGLDTCLKYMLIQNFGDLLEPDDWEYVFISNDLTDSKVYLSPKLHSQYVLSEMFDYWNVDSTDQNKHLFQKNGNLLLWHNSFVDTKKNFYTKVLNELENKLVNIVCLRKDYRNISAAPYTYNSSKFYSMSLCSLEEKQTDYDVVHTSKRMSRCTQINFNIDKHVSDSTDEIFLMFGTECCCRKPLNRHFMFECTLCYDPTSTKMSNLSFLHLCDVNSVNADFFKQLFEQCHMLTTLNVDNMVQSMYSSSLIKSLSLASSLKNLRIKDPGVLQSMMFECFSKCTTLENVHICDMSPKTGEISNENILSFLKKNTRLYCFYLFANFSNFSVRGKKQMITLKKQIPKIIGRAFFHIDFIHVKTSSQYKLKMSPNPLSDVFFLENVHQSINVKFQTKH